MPTEIPGYGDPECYCCDLIKKRRKKRLCKLMVEMTKAQIAAAKAGRIDEAIVYEGRQNDIALEKLPECVPGFIRV